MKTLKEQIAELRAVGYKALPAQAKVAHDAVLLAMHRSGFKLKSAIKGGVVMSSITGDIRRATMDMDIDFVHHSIGSARYMRKLASARINWLGVLPRVATAAILRIAESL